MSSRREFLASAVASTAYGGDKVTVLASGAALTLFELRNYITRPGQRDALIEMFERSFLDAYEAGGTRVLGTFRNLDDGDRWVWIRAFRDAESRGQALNNFYTSRAWRREAGSANDTIADTSNVLLMRLIAGGTVARHRPAGSQSLILVTTYVIEPRSEDEFADFFLREASPALGALGGAPFAIFVTDRRPNTYSRQFVRQDTALVTLTRFRTVQGHAAFEASREAAPEWRTRIAPEIARRLLAPVEVLRLQPTDRSELR